MKRLPLILLLAAFAAFGFGLTQLYKLRFEAGDVYPEYSTLRADPLGAKAFYESLERLITAQRHFRPLHKLDDGRESALFFLAVETAGFNLSGEPDVRFRPDEFKALEDFAKDGGRIVISFFPSYVRHNTNRFAARGGPPPARVAPAPSPPNKKTRDEDEEDRFGEFKTESIKKRWDLAFYHAALPKNDAGAYEPDPAYRQSGDALPASLACHTALVFTNLASAWRVIYARTNDRAVLIERDLGRGSLVLAADSYPFSNEALRADRQPELLAWFTGASRRAIFDETHLGVEENPGVASLARKYRLHGVFAGLVALAALFVWKNSVSFMPPYAEELARERGELVTGRDSAAGFVNLLRRNIPSSEIMKVCLEQWNAQFGHARKPSLAKLEAMQKLIEEQNALPPRQRSPVRTYQRFCEILARVKRRT